MTKLLTTEQLKAQVEEVLAALEAGGDEVIVLRNGVAIARITPERADPVGTSLSETDPARRPRTPGRDRGKFVIPDAFYEPMSEEELKDWGM